MRMSLAQRATERLLAALLVGQLSLLAAGCAAPEPEARRTAASAVWVAEPAPERAVRAVEATASSDLTPSSSNRAKTEIVPARQERPQSDRTGAPVSVTTAGADGKRVHLDFQDTDVRALVDAVLGDMLKLQYAVAPQVQGKVTVRTGKPIEKAALLSTLEVALGSVSAALVAQEGGYLVVPTDSLPQRVRAAARSNSAALLPGYSVEIVPLRYVAAKDIQRLLDVLAPKGSVLFADEVHNHIMIVGSGVDRTLLLKTIENFDIDAMSGMAFAFYRVDNVGTEQLLAELKQVFQPPLDLLGTRVRLVPIERLRLVLGISAFREDLETLDTWIKRLDAAPKSSDRRLFVYNVQHGKARDLAVTLQAVLSTDGASDTRSPPISNSTGSVRQDQVTNTPAVGSRFGGMRLVANEENNSLVLYSTAAEFNLVRDAMQKLDAPARQVLIEAILAEVTLGDDLRFGVQWFFDSGGGQATLSSVATGAILSQFPGFSYIRAGSADARSVINALQSRTDVKVLSAPRLAVLNNQKANLQVGDEVPILTQQAQSTSGAGSPVVSTIQMRDTGVLLEVSPRVNDNGNVILEVTQEVSDVTATTTSGIDSPTIQRRRLRSVISTRDGATVALGGLIRESTTRSNSGVPLLKDLPFLGHLFKSSTVATRRTELIVLLVPRVMRDSAEVGVVTDEFLRAFSEAAALASTAAPLVRKPTD